MAGFHSHIWAIMAIHYFLILVFSGAALSAPIKTDSVKYAKMELLEQKIEAYLETARSDTAQGTPQIPWDYVWGLFSMFPAFNFGEVPTTCKENSLSLATSFAQIASLQRAVSMETFKQVPDTNAQAWDWFFMKNHEDDPNGWDRNPNTYKAWRAITRNIEIMRATPTSGFSGKGVNLMSNQVWVICGEGLANSNCEKGAWAFVIDPEKNGAVTRWELHLCDKFFNLARTARTMLGLLNQDDRDYMYLSDLQTRDVVLIHEFGHLWNFDYVDGFRRELTYQFRSENVTDRHHLTMDPIDPGVPCKLQADGKVYGAECAWKLAWVNQKPQGRGGYAEPNVEVASCCENYAWWHNKRFFDMNKFNVPLNYKLIPGGGIPQNGVMNGSTSDSTAGADTWNSSMIGPRRGR